MNFAAFESLLQGSQLLAALEPDQRTALLQQGAVITFRAGQPVHAPAERQGVFLVLSGRVRLVGSSQGRDYVVANLEPGDHFGGLPLEGERRGGIERQGNLQPRAASEVSVLHLPAEAFDRVLDQDPGLRSFLQRCGDDLALRQFLKQFTVLAPLTATDLKRVVGALREQERGAGEFVFHQGEAGDAFYLVRQGRVEIVRSAAGRQVVLRVLRAGDFFGELALLYGQARTAGARCLDPVRLYSLARSDFEELVRTHPEVKERLQQALSLYQMEANLAQRFEPESAPRPAPVSTPELSHDSVATGPKTPLRGTGRPVILQHGESDCGAASLAMVLRHWGQQVGLARLREMAGVSREGASLLSLKDAAERLGFQADGVRATYAGLQRMPLPLIAHWEGNHFVVVYSATPRQVVVADPGIGLRKMTPSEFGRGWTGYALRLVPTGSWNLPPPTRLAWQHFLPLVKPYRGLLGEILLTSVILGLLGLASPVFTQLLVDRVLVQGSLSLLHLMAAGMALLILFQAAVTGLRRYLLAYLSNRLDLSLLVRFYQHLLSLPLDYFERRRLGDFLARFSEAQKVRDLLTGLALTTLLDSLMVVLAVALMLHYNPRLTLIMLVFVPFFAVTTLGFTPWLRRANREVFHKYADSESLLAEAIGGLSTLKTATAEQRLRWRWENLYTQSLNRGRQAQSLRLGVETLSGLLEQFSWIAVLLMGAGEVLRGALTVGQLMAFSGLVGTVMGPLSRLLTLWDDIQEGLQSLERLGDVLEAEGEGQRSGQERIRPGPLRGHILLDNVTFRYGGREERNIVANLSLEIHPGQTVALVGRSGSGKTTLAKLLQGFYKPSEGRILIDGHDLETLHLGEYRRQLGVVSQDAHLFAGTIADNIALGDPEPDIARIVRAATVANAHDFITSTPAGYQARLGERGNTLSGGQRQRLMLARALYASPRLLILDEATSSLDLESERAIQNGLRQELKGRTALIIAHRLSTVQEADLIVVLDRGAIVEQGTHRTLMERRGLYYYLNSNELRL